jgi:hypothetical protein
MKTMDKKVGRALGLIITFLLTTSLASASIASWIMRKPCDWDFVQKVGGMEVSVVRLENGRPAAKVRFDPTGGHAITCRPVLLNSALIFDQASVRVRHGEVWVKVYTLAPGRRRTYSDTMTVPLPRNTHGNYRLRYENPDYSFFEMGALIVP